LLLPQNSLSLGHNKAKVIRLIQDSK
jgi:hypothetical protein